MPVLEWRIVTDADPVSTVIRGVSRGTVSHVEFILPDAMTLGARWDGVKIRPINYAQFSVDIRFAARCTFGQYEAASTFLTAQLGKSYDYGAVFGIWLDRDWRDPRRWFCSELWTATLEHAGLMRRLHAKINHVTPEDALLLSSAIWPAWKAESDA